MPDAMPTGAAADHRLAHHLWRCDRHGPADVTTDAARGRQPAAPHDGERR